MSNASDLATVVSHILSVTSSPLAALPASFEQIQDILHLSAKQQYAVWSLTLINHPNAVLERHQVRNTAVSLAKMGWPILPNTGQLRGLCYAQIKNNPSFLTNNNKPSGSATVRFAGSGNLTKIIAKQLAGIAHILANSHGVLTHA